MSGTTCVTSGGAAPGRGSRQAWHCRCAVFAFIAWLTTMGVTARVWADDVPAQVAEALFREARALMTAGKFPEACRKLEESQRLDPGAGTLLNLAACYEHLGLTASAWATYGEAASLAERGAYHEWETTARKRAALLEPTLTTLTISVPSASHVPGMRIERDGISVERAQWGVPIPVDPRSHSIVVSAPGRLSWSTTVSVQGNAGNASITVPVLTSSAPEPIATPVLPAAQTRPPDRPRPVKSDVPHPRDGQSSIGLVVGGVGVIGLAAGSVFGLMAKSAYDESSAHCDERDRCTRDGLDLDERAHRWATLSTVSFGVGVVAVATGGALLVTAPASPSQNIAVGSAPVPGGATFSMKGVW